jgi:hypothetical protein
VFQPAGNIKLWVITKDYRFGFLVRGYLEILIEEKKYICEHQQKLKEIGLLFTNVPGSYCAFGDFVDDRWMEDFLFMKQHIFKHGLSSVPILFTNKQIQSWVKHRFKGFRKVGRYFFTNKTPR